MTANYYAECKQSERLGKGRNFISHIRQHNNDKYCHILALSTTEYFEDGYPIYEEQVDRVVDEWLNLYNELEEFRRVKEFTLAVPMNNFTLYKIGTRIQITRPIYKMFRRLELMIPKMEAFLCTPCTAINTK